MNKAVYFEVLGDHLFFRHHAFQNSKRYKTNAIISGGCTDVYVLCAGKGIDMMSGT